MTHTLRPRRWDLFACVALILLNTVWCVALILPFSLLDDTQYIIDNEFVRNGLSWHTVGWAFTTTLGGFWFPLTWLSLALDATLFGPRAWGFHATNILFHIANTLLLYAFFRTVIARRTADWGKCLFAAALFSIHPQRVESVVWATERKDVLAVFFGLLALLAYARYARSPNPRRYVIVLLLYLCSLMSKPMLVTFPAVLLLLDFWPLQRFSRSTFWPLVKEKIPLLLIGVAISVDTYLIQFTAGALGSSWDVRWKNAVLGYFLSIRDFFYVGHLAVVYGTRPAIPWEQVAGSAIFLLAATAGILWSLRRSSSGARALAVGWLWFLGVLFPMSGVLQSGVNIRADRFTYFPAIGLIIALVWGLLPLLDVRKWPRWIGRSAAALTIVLFAALSVNRALLWRDPLLLFEHDLQFENNGFLQQMAGSAAKEQGFRDRALDHFRKAGELEPGLRFLYPLQKSEYDAADTAARGPSPSTRPSTTP